MTSELPDEDRGQLKQEKIASLKLKFILILSLSLKKIVRAAWGSRRLVHEQCPPLPASCIQDVQSTPGSNENMRASGSAKLQWVRAPVQQWIYTGGAACSMANMHGELSDALDGGRPCGLDGGLHFFLFFS